MTSRTSSHWLPKLLRTRTVAAALVLASMASVIVTYIAITRHAGPLVASAKIIVALILVNLVLLLTLGAIVARRAVRLWASLKEGSVGSRLQTRIIAMFTLITLVPTVIVSVFSALFFNFGIQSWFDERVSTALEESVAVAEAYLAEHKDSIRNDAAAMAADLDQKLSTGIPPTQFSALVERQAAGRWLSEAIVFQQERQQVRVLAQTQLTFSLAFEPLPRDYIDRADNGEIIVMLEGQDKVQALIKLKNLPDTYLLVGRFIDSKVLGHVDTANGSVQQYRRLKDNISALQIEFSVVFVLVALVLLCAAIWYGMHFAARLIVPVTTLVKASERVRAGDFTVRVAEGPKDDEVGTLARAFNRMTDELEKQRRDLIEANRQIDSRRRLTEAVLSGVSAGVIALSHDKRVTLANPVAASLLLLPADTVLKDQILTDIVPEFGALFAKAETPGTQAQEDITITRSDKSHVLHVRLAVERLLDSIEGYIVTFDDITELLIAQRSAAWSDVARRVAHEIKNPLTPIQLSAERLRKKYLPQITAEAENYTKYIDTIAKHARDIGKIVEEFVAFARMPAPVMKKEDITGIIRKAVFSEQTTHPDIAYRLQLPENPIAIRCDEQQISRALLNLLKNAAEALEAREGSKNVITVQCAAEEGRCKVRIFDNGPGFPPDKMHRLLEPYITTRAKGTGLGLAIVKKIIDDHKGQIALENLPEGGACITLTFAMDGVKG